MLLTHYVIAAHDVIFVYNVFFYFLFYSKVPAFGDDFKRPLYIDEAESSDELSGLSGNNMFGFQVFSNPIEIQKYHERQMQHMLKAFEQFDGKMRKYSQYHNFFVKNHFFYRIFENFLSKSIEFRLKSGFFLKFSSKYVIKWQIYAYVL